VTLFSVPAPINLFAVLHTLAPTRPATAEGIAGLPVGPIRFITGMEALTGFLMIGRSRHLPTRKWNASGASDEK